MQPLRIICVPTNSGVSIKIHKPKQLVSMYPTKSCIQKVVFHNELHLTDIFGHSICQPRFMELLSAKLMLFNLEHINCMYLFDPP